MDRLETDRKIGLYLKSIDVRSMEFFEEMYDHILSSYDNRKDPDESIEHHLNEVIQPSFGGVKGIKAIVKKQQKLRQKALLNRFFQISKQYFLSWPYAAYTVMITLLVVQANHIFDPKNVLTYIMAIGVISTIAISGYGSLKFYLSCRRANKPYSYSDANNRLLGLATLGTSFTNLFLNLFGTFFFGSQKAALEFYTNYPVLQVAMCTVFSLYALVYLKIHKEKFVHKISI